MKQIGLAVLICIAFYAGKATGQTTVKKIRIRISDPAKDCAHINPVIRKACTDNLMTLVLRSDGLVGWK